MHKLILRYLLLLASILFAITIAYLFDEFPFFSILCIDILVCLFLYFIFINQKYAFCFLLHPFLIFLLSFSISNSWFENGDGPAHAMEAENILEFGVLYQIDAIATQYNNYNPLFISKVLSLGSVPGLIIPKLLFKNPSQEVYIVTQSLVYIFLLSVFLPLIIYWDVIKENLIFLYTIFLAIGPSLLLYTYAPHRHFITQFSLLLVFLSHLSLKKRISIDRIITLLLGLFLMIISKQAYFLLYGIFVLLDYFISKSIREKYGQKKLNININVIFISLLIIMSKYYLDYFGGNIDSILDQSKVISTSVQYPGQNIPVISFFYKYIFALLAPFPWSKANLYVRDIFGGSWLHFILHIMSAFIGLYLFMSILYNFKKISRLDSSFRSSVLFGLCISAGVIGGSTAFHNYITPSFVFLLPIVLFESLRIRLRWPIYFIFFLELVVDSYQALI